MGRASKKTIERLNKETAIERVLASYGIKTSTKKRSIVAPCPFHDGGNVSLVVDRAANTWACAKCKLRGTVIDFVKRIEGVSLTHAVALLKAGELGKRGREKKLAKKSTVRKLASPLDAGSTDEDLLRQVVDYYGQELKQSPDALDYLQARGLTSSEIIDTFKIGFANRTLGYRIPDKAWHAGREIRERLQRIGILKNTGHELFRGSIVIPVFDEHGRVAQLHGRKVARTIRERSTDHTQLPGGPRGVWNRQALTSATVILCQSLIDGLTVWCAGFRNVTAVAGYNGLTDEHVVAFKQSAVQKVLVAFRRDDAGDRAALAVAQKLTGVGVTCHRVEFPVGMDANDFALKHTPATKHFARVFRNAAWMGIGTKPSGGVAVPAPVHAPARRTSTPSAKTSPPRIEATPEPLPDPADAIEPAPIVEPEVPTTQNDAEVVIDLGDRRYRIRGLAKCTSYDSLKVNLLASRGGVEQAGFHVDSFDRYQAKARAAFVKQAALELGLAEDLVKHDLGKVLLKLEALQEVQIRDALKPKTVEVVLDEHERNAAMALLTDPRLLDRVLVDFERCGVVGEQSNKLVGYLAAVSRKLDDPLAILIQSSSAAGKTSLMDSILAFVPEEDRVHFSAMTGQSLFYMGETNLKHKILAVAEEEGAERASYALKLLQSEKHISIASTAKEASTGRLVTQEYRVEGPTQLMLTTTAIEIDEELLNRCIVLTVNEDRQQTQAIHRLQRERETLDGLLARSERASILKLHQDAQRLLRPLVVVNPYARELTFLDDRTRTRRDHGKYLALIRVVALLHQCQRPVRTVTNAGKVIQFIEVTPEDVAVANKLAHEVLGRSLDELPPQTRALLLQLDRMVREDCEAHDMERSDYRFTRRYVRERLGAGDTQLKIHLQRLVELELVAVHRGDPAHRHAYELLYDGGGKDGTPFLTGLIDASKLQRLDYDAARSGSGDARSGSGRPLVGGWSGAGRGAVSDENAIPDADFDAKNADADENARPGNVSTTLPYAKDDA